MSALPKDNAEKSTIADDDDNGNDSDVVYVLGEPLYLPPTSFGIDDFAIALKNGNLQKWHRRSELILSLDTAYKLSCIFTMFRLNCDLCLMLM